MPDKAEGMPKVKVEIELQVNEMLKLLKEAYATRSASAALEQFIEDHDDEIARIGRERALQRVQMQGKYKTDNNGDESE